jgi:hypothetical protein
MENNVFAPYVGLTDSSGKLISGRFLTSSCKHCHGGKSPGALAGDGVDNLVLIDFTGENANITTL